MSYEADRAWQRWRKTHAQGFDAAHMAFLAGYAEGKAEGEALVLRGYKVQPDDGMKGGKSDE